MVSDEADVRQLINMELFQVENKSWNNLEGAEGEGRVYAMYSSSKALLPTDP